MRSNFSILLTCEHASSSIPEAWGEKFSGHEHWLLSHRGWDPGAHPLAEHLQAFLGTPLFTGTNNRLLIDLNRPEDSPELFSSVSNAFSIEDRNRLLDTLHRPHWKQIQNHIETRLKNGKPVLHIGVHSFTPVYRGQRRDVDIGLLYDPTHDREKRLTGSWTRNLRTAAPHWTVCANQPYRGDAPGMTTFFRNHFNSSYLGLEIEIKSTLLKKPENIEKIAGLLVTSLPDYSG